MTRERGESIVDKLGGPWIVNSLVMLKDQGFSSMIIDAGSVTAVEEIEEGIRFLNTQPRNNLYGPYKTQRGDIRAVEERTSTRQRAYNVKYRLIIKKI